MSPLSGKVQTVLGLVEPNKLGRTLTHEHLTMTFNCSYHPPPPSHEALSREPIMMKNLFWIQKNPYSHKENLQLNQETEAIKEELLYFKAKGGGALVENTTTGISRDVQTLKRLAEETGIHIISGAGFYVDATHTSETRAMSVEQVKRPTIFDRICVYVSKYTEARIRTIHDKKELLEFAQLGCYLEYDLFGTELLHYQFNPDIDMPDDNKRIRRVRLLVDEGYEDRILMAHDIHTKHRLMKYGGHGYSHILTNVVPKMLLRGITENALDKILIENPKQWLTFK
ncbi:phosphotriesterase-related protein [Pteropus vampyrus]|uniref:N-acetyltaurine hydrolase n=1 Tax=Pteropus vampyrus TaxID=132908 RepID=A0A6P6BU54_PTEVA|nr:phosphotriesterase-related protein [Pteropus vampyrus]